MNHPSRSFLLFFIFFFNGYFNHAQTSPLWNNLKQGNYKVGFTCQWKMDYSRAWGQSDMVKEDYSNKPYGRPVRISMWYPATSSANAKPMKMKDYLYINTNDPTAAKAQATIAGKDIGDNSKSIKGLFSGDEKEFQKFLNTSSEAVLNAAYIKGQQFPLLIYSLGQNDYTFENVILFEYLASRGFVVISVPHLGVNARKDYLLADEPLSFETQVRDLEFALSQSLDHPFVNKNKIGALGMSFGTIYSLLLTARNPNIKALVGLDGTVMGGLEPYAYKYWQSPFYDSSNIKVPVLQLFRQDHKDMGITNSLQYSDRYLLEIKDLTHADFTSYPMYTLKIPKNLLDTFAYARRTPAYAAEMFEKICETVGFFFEATLNNKSLTSKNFIDGHNENNISTKVINGIISPNEEEFAKIILNGGLDSAIALYKTLEKKFPGTKWLRQRKINRIGYEMIYNSKVEEAIKIFGFNVIVFPENPDVYDSLGEAYMIVGNKEMAIANYKRCLQLDPKNENAKKMVDNLQSQR